MGEVAVTLGAGTLELARRQVLGMAATDLRRAAEMVQEGHEVGWPEPMLVGDAQATLALARESLAAVERLGWPDTANPEES